jgi:CubicO group peptidase (beta-lactamase class C family)
MKELQKELEELIAPWQNIPGVAVCIVFADRPPVFASSGYSSLEYGLRIDPNTRFNIASVSKQFTGFATRLLEKRGLLNLDDPIQKYLPELSQTYKDIQIHHLLHHTSGFRDMYNIQAYAGFRRDDIFTREQLLALTKRQTELNFKPGERFVYNNTGYVMLAEIVRCLTGMDMRHFLEAEIFQPLGMQNTFLCDNHKEMIPNFAGHYNRMESGSYTKAFENVAVSGSTNIITSIVDFSRWLGNYVTPRLEPEVMMGLNLTHPFNNGQENMYACGLELSERAGRKLWTHGGGAGGFRSEMIFVPSEGVAVGVLSNNGSMDAATLGSRVLGLVIPQLMPEGQGSRGVKSVAFSEIEGKDLPGVYRMPDGLLATVEASENQLFIHTPFYPVRLPLIKTDEMRYRIEILNAELVAEYDEHGKVCAFSSKTPLGEMHSIKLPPIELDEAALSEYSGRYWNEELLNMWEVGVTEERLTFFHPHFPEIRFFPVLHDEFSSDTENFEKLKFIRDENHQVTALELSGDRAFNIRFKRVKEVICCSEAV